MEWEMRKCLSMWPFAYIFNYPTSIECTMMHLQAFNFASIFPEEEAGLMKKKDEKDNDDDAPYRFFLFCPRMNAMHFHRYFIGSVSKSFFQFFFQTIVSSSWSVLRSITKSLELKFPLNLHCFAFLCPSERAATISNSNDIVCNINWQKKRKGQ